MEPHVDELTPAATVILGRDGTDGFEVLLLRRSDTVGFGGAWVFPGGRVDDDDPGSTDLERAKSAAIRESMEETGLDIADTRLTQWSYWEPPLFEAMVAKGKKRRYATWFFLAEAPSAEVAVDMGEIHEHQWLTPQRAIDLQRAGELPLIPPTFVTLTQLAEHGTLGDAIGAADVQRFITRPLAQKPTVLAWEGDVAYDDPSLIDAEGPRNRFVMTKGNWTYERR